MKTKKYIIVNDYEIVFVTEELKFAKRFIEESINPQLYQIYKKVEK